MLLDGVHLLDAYIAAFGSNNLRLVAGASSISQEEVTARVALTSDASVLSDTLFDDIASVRPRREAPTAMLLP